MEIYLLIYNYVSGAIGIPVILFFIQGRSKRVKVRYVLCSIAFGFITTTIIFSIIEFYRNAYVALMVDNDTVHDCVYDALFTSLSLENVEGEYYLEQTTTNIIKNLKHKGIL